MCPLQAVELMFKLAGGQLAGGNHPGRGAKAVLGPLGYLPFRQGGFPVLWAEHLKAIGNVLSPSHHSTPSVLLSMAASLCCAVPHASTETLCANVGKVPAKSWITPDCNSCKKCLSVALMGTTAHRGTMKVAHPGQQTWCWSEPASLELLWQQSGCSLHGIQDLILQRRSPLRSRLGEATLAPLLSLWRQDVSSPEIGGQSEASTMVWRRFHFAVGCIIWIELESTVGTMRENSFLKRYGGVRSIG